MDSSINVDELLKMINQVYKYKEDNKRYNFYYDETNNYRKVRITKSGFNNNEILSENYVLGGICINQNSNPNDINKLIDNLIIDKTIELKSGQLYGGKREFDKCIRIRNLGLILEWILNNAYIHYTDMDCLYYTIIDIIDSICNNEILTANELVKRLETGNSAYNDGYYIKHQDGQKYIVSKPDRNEKNNLG